ncbi:hypothetical protein FACS189454_09760 [Planctomycetales bacterium]|nr:hypothetical protein FACS189443_6370 [Planctomycetales bacterium]GHT47399.1 hypothetical protein FACS189454_09760 [Planctomycetales bacterium]
MTATNIAMPFYLPDTGRILPPQTELTPEQAAEFLCVSESFMLELLDSGEIESRNEGKQRQVALRSLVKYDQKWAQQQTAALDKLIQLSEEMGLYDD